MLALVRRLVGSVSALSLALAPIVVRANPLNGHVAAGSATIAGQGTSKVTIDQSTNRAIINWGSFNIAPGETTQFVQPGASSVTLNRVTGGLGASQINGMIQANGGVYVVNPDGILFGPSARVNVGSFLGTTHDIANSDFMAGRGDFSISGNPSASIVNQGAITAANGGFAALVAPGVRNDGIITANLGTVALASGNGFTLDLYGDNLIKLQPGEAIASNVIDVATGQTLKSLVQNTGTLKANGGRVALTAVAAEKVLDSVINSSGVIEANSVGMKNGLVVFGASTTGASPQIVKVSGKIRAMGRKRGATGGKIQITGRNIQIAHATLDVSGHAGGGAILIGGDLHGAGLLAQAQSVTMDSASVVHADATGAGKGGEVVFWSTGDTSVHGLITAMGGPNGGDGGTVETSGHAVDFAGLAVNTSALLGVGGTWLLDPTDLTIGSGDAATIVAALNLGTSVTLATTAGAPTETGVTGVGTQSAGNGDININSGISWTGSAALTLQAFNNINVNAAVSLGAGTLSLYAAGSTAGTTTSLNTGAITINAPINVSGAGAINIKANSLSSLTVDGVATTFSPTDLELSFGKGGSISYGATNNGGSLNINGAGYNLLYSVASIAGIDTNGDTLKYALATSVANSTTYTAALAGAGADDNATGKVFSGVFEGLGNTITNLQISSSAGNQYLGLFGQSSGIIRDLILSGGTVSSGTVVDTDSVGALVGMNLGGLVANVTSSTSVSGSGTPAYFNPNGSGAPSDYISAGGGVGGLVGANVAGNVMQSQATGTVSDPNGFFQNAVGGLVGINTGNIDINDTGWVGGAGTATILYSSATGQVNGGSDSFIGGLVGSNIGSGANGFYNSGGTLLPEVAATANIIGSWASGNVSGSFAGITGTVVFDNTSAGGLAGGDQDGEIAPGRGLILDSYATGNVSDSGNSGTSPGNNNGGLVGYEGTNSTQDGGTVVIKNSYATGAVTGLSGDIIGGAIGGDCESNAGCNFVYGLGTITDVYYSNGVADSDPTDGATSVTTTQLKGPLSLSGISAPVWTAGASGNGNDGFPTLTTNAPVPPTTPLTYTVADATSVYGTLATLGAVTLSGNPANVVGTISLYNSSDVLVTFSAALGQGIYTEEVTGLTGSGASAYTIAGAGNTFGTLTIDKASLTVTADNEVSTYGGALPTLTASYSGFVNGDTSASLTRGPTFSVGATSSSNVGVYAITASGAVDPNYAITYVPGALTIGQAALTITADNKGSTYGGALPTLTASYTGLVNGDTAASLATAPTLSTTGLSSSNAGAYPITASGAVDSNYAITYAPGTLTIGQAALTITADNKGSTYGGALPTLTASYSGLVNGDTAASLTSPATLAVGATSSSNAGAYAITASGAVDSNYSITYVPGVLTIGQAALTITADNKGSTYGGALPTLSASYSGFVNGDTLASLTTVPTLTTPATSSSNAGAYAITASGAIDSNYAITYVPGVLTIGQASLTITASNAGMTYGGAFPTLTASYSGFVNGDTSARLTTLPAFTVNAIPSSNAGSYTITPLGAVDNNYAITYVPGVLTIGQAALTITANNVASTYGAAPVLTASYSGLVNGDTAASLTTLPTLSSTGTSSSNVGAYPITASGAVDGNYAITYAPGTLTIGQATLTITADNKGSTYGGALPTLTASYSGFVNGDTAASLTTLPTIFTTGTSASPAGAYPITASGAAGSSNYAITYVPGVLTIGQATLTITADNKGSTYGGALPTLSASYSGFVNGDTVASLTTVPVLTTPATSSSNTGAYAITASGAVDGNYAITYVPGTLTIGQASLTITASNAGMTYGGAFPTLSASYSGFVNGDTSARLTTLPAFTVNAIPSSNAGSYTITPLGAVDSNYAITYVPGVLTIGQAALTITANNVASTYGASPALTASYSGLVNGDTAASLATPPTLSTTGTSSSNVGAYPITASGAVDNNYAITYVPGTLTIGQAALTITADNKGSTYGGALPTLTASYSGFVNGDTSAILTTIPTLSTTGTSSSNAGAYAITASGAIDSNYAITYVPGTLTIGQAALTITADNKGSTYGGALPTLSASYSGFVNGDTFVSLTTVPTLTTPATSSSNAGAYAITASGAIDSNYSITYVPGVLTIGQAALTITADNKGSTYGGALPTLTASYNGFVNGDTSASLTTGPALAVGAISSSNAGAYAITASSAVDSNYAITYVPGVLTIGQAALTITPTAQSKAYGSPILDPTQFTELGLVNGDKITGLTLASGGAAATAPVGVYDITASNATGAGLTNYVIAYDIGIGALTVDPAHIIVTANSGASVYGSLPSNPGLTATGLQNGQSASVLTGLSNSFGVTAASDVDSGPYVLSVVGALSNPNYTIDQRNTGLWTVTPATLTYVANPVSRASGVANPAFTGSVSGFVLSDTLANATSGVLTFASSASSTSPPGGYAILGSGLTADNGDYIFVQAGANATALTVKSNTIFAPSEWYIADMSAPGCYNLSDVQVQSDAGVPNSLNIVKAATRLPRVWARGRFAHPIQCQ